MDVGHPLFRKDMDEHVKLVKIINKSWIFKDIWMMKKIHVEKWEHDVEGQKWICMNILVPHICQKAPKRL